MEYIICVQTLDWHINVCVCVYVRTCEDDEAILLVESWLLIGWLLTSGAFFLKAVTHAILQTQRSPGLQFPWLNIGIQEPAKKEPTLACILLS